MNCPSCSLPIDQHEAGRSTDRCVAEARGWTNMDEEEVEGFDLLGYPPKGKLSIIPFFSTSFAACEELIEEMTKDYCNVETRHLRGTSSTLCEVKVDCREGFIYQKASTFPHAISLAYLSWRGSNG